MNTPVDENELLSIEQLCDRLFISATKIIIFSILATYYIAFAVGVWVVVTKDFYQLSVLLTFVGGVTAAAVAFYCWKAKAENLLKIKAAYPELSGTLSDFSSMTQ